MEANNKLIVFESKKIRRTWNEDEWYYSIIDICAVLTDSSNPRDYWYQANPICKHICNSHESRLKPKIEKRFQMPPLFCRP